MANKSHWGGQYCNLLIIILLKEVFPAESRLPGIRIEFLLESFEAEVHVEDVAAADLAVGLDFVALRLVGSFGGAVIVTL